MNNKSLNKLSFRNTVPATIRVLAAGLVLGLLASCANTPSHNEPKTGSTTSPSNGQKLDGHYICVNPQQYVGKVVGDGHCVALIKQCSGAPNTVEWRQGKRVLEQPVNSIKPGTIIATFKDGRYPNRRGYHAAIYINHDKHGIWVWDQWRGKAVHKRLIRTRRDRANSSNSAQDYRMVRQPKN